MLRARDFFSLFCELCSLNAIGTIKWAARSPLNLPDLCLLSGLPPFCPRHLLGRVNTKKRQKECTGHRDLVFWPFSSRVVRARGLLPRVRFSSFLPSPLTGPCRHQKKAKRMYGTQGLSFLAFLLTCCTCAWTFFFVCVFPRGKLVENSRKSDRRQTLEAFARFFQNLDGLLQSLVKMSASFLAPN
jgi:hypothetical protein